jgi:hypothetical protein
MRWFNIGLALCVCFCGAIVIAGPHRITELTTQELERNVGGAICETATQTVPQATSCTDCFQDQVGTNFRGCNNPTQYSCQPSQTMLFRPTCTVVSSGCGGTAYEQTDGNCNMQVMPLVPLVCGNTVSSATTTIAGGGNCP